MRFAGRPYDAARAGTSTRFYWGDDTNGQLGSDDTPAARSRFVSVSLQDVRAIACGFQHSCAMLGNGEAYCWGDNGHGGLGTGDTSPTDTPLMMTLPDGMAARSIYSGSGTVATCVELATGAVYCAGYNYYGELGLGTLYDQYNTPTEVTSWP